MFVGVFAFFTIQEGNFTSGFLAVLFAALCGIWLFVGLAAHFVGDAIVRGIWGEEIKAERDRLLQKFPAAKDAV